MAKSNGIKLSWKNAKNLHSRSKNNKSTVSAARSFLSTTSYDRPIESLLKEYDKYLLKYQQPKHGGLQMSWDNAKDLHNQSKNNNSTVYAARSYLSTTSYDQPIEHLLKEYDEYLSHNSKKPRISSKETNTNKKRTSNVLASVNVETMVRIKQFIKENHLAIDELKNLLDLLQQIQA